MQPSSPLLKAFNEAQLIRFDQVSALLGWNETTEKDDNVCEYFAEGSLCSAYRLNTGEIVITNYNMAGDALVIPPCRFPAAPRPTLIK